MAQGVNINQRIVIIGGDDARRQLEGVAKVGEQLGVNIQKGAERANQGLKTFETGLNQVEVSAKATRYAAQNLTFQINDVVTSLASGISPFRTFTQQGGQFVQLFQQGGGVGNVLRELASRFSGVISPSKLALGGIVAIGAEAGVLGEKVLESSDRVRRFGVILNTLGGGPTVLRGGEDNAQRLNFPTAVGPQTAQELTDLTTKFRDLALAPAEVAKRFEQIRREGILPLQVDFGKLVRAGENLNTALGAGSSDKLTSAIAELLKGNVAPATELAKQVGLIGQNSNLAANGLGNAAGFLEAFKNKMGDANVNALDPFSRRLREVNTEFQGFQDRLAQFFKEGVVNFGETIGAFNDLGRAISAAFNRGDVDGLNRALAETKKQIKESTFGGTVQGVADIAKGVEDRIPRMLGGTQGPPIQQQIQATDPVGGFALATGIVDDITKVFTAENPFAELEVSAKETGNSILSYYTSIANAINDVLGTNIQAPGSRVVASAAIPPATGGGSFDTGSTNFGTLPDGFSSGGLFKGAGSGTSDSNSIRISDGEYIVNAVGTRANFPLLEAINSIGRPIRSNSRGFAAGGLVGSGGLVDSRTKFTLFIEGRPYADLVAPDATANSLLQHARTSDLISLGKSPSWKR
jgi:hypothetical protein